MNLTAQQRKALWIAVAIIGALYIARSVMERARQQEYYQQQAIRAAQQRQAKQAAHPSAPVPTTTTPPAPPKPVVPLSGFAGIWRGGTAIDGRGMCNLRIELHEPSPGSFTGFSTLACNNFAPLMAKQDRSMRAFILNRTRPANAILSGTLQNGLIVLKVDTTLSTNSNGCAATSFTLTPFIADRMSVQWTEATCEGGQIILGRSKS
jgi:hypothetical protein